jgi:hypothetical protein
VSSKDQLKPKYNQIEQTLEGSFSAVSTPIFASIYSFRSIFRDLQDYQSGFPIFAIFQCLRTVFCFKDFILFHFGQIARS